MANIPLNNLLGNHGADEVKRWVQSLRYFTFTGAYSTERVQFSEELVLYVSFKGHDDLVLVLGKLGILTRGDGAPPSPIATPGPRNVAAFPDVVEPGDCTIAGVACNVVVTSAALTITVAENGGGVTAVRVADAKRIEAQLDALGFGSRISGPNSDYVIGRDRFA
jgi:hypothetical protein